ncbi:hypothetical protein KZP23_15105 [Echinicola marina]|uniref:hypothetical protein n=1 Tax=Echinicola marina TaxID=2859768 RepID=UPI001CF6A31D|nr:hypothetical protein [Echinicola marina]UCS92042.1 hypothetical protein KZP23_15105 [Echinicola marina]
MEYKIQLKKELLEECRKKQQSLIDDFQFRLHELKGIRDLDDEDINSGNRRAFDQSEYNSLFQALDFAEAEMGILSYLSSKDEKLCEAIELGSVVVTNLATFFVSVSIEQFSSNDIDYLGISTHSPLFIAMRGLKPGDQFQYEGKEYRINDVF